MAVYTGTGDSGETSLLGNTRKSKNNEVFSVLGTLDEFNASLGLALSQIKFTKQASDFLVQAQRDLFKVGSLIADPKVKEDEFLWLEKHIKTFEEYIDDMEEKLPELRNFILPGGGEGSALIHFSRTVCRRLERELVGYFEKNGPGQVHVVKYVNRLSDFLFTLARYLNFKDNIKDVIWADENE